MINLFGREKVEDYEITDIQSIRDSVKPNREIKNSTPSNFEIENLKSKVEKLHSNLEKQAQVNRDHETKISNLFYEIEKKDRDNLNLKTQISKLKADIDMLKSKQIEKEIIPKLDVKSITKSKSKPNNLKEQLLKIDKKLKASS